MTTMIKTWTLQSLIDLEDEMFELNSVPLAAPSLQKADQIEFAESSSKAKSKPKCIKGTACGYACISGRKQCSERIKARDAAELLRQTGTVVDTMPAKPKPTNGLSDVVSGPEATKLAKSANWYDEYSGTASNMSLAIQRDLNWTGDYDSEEGKAKVAKRRLLDDTGLMLDLFYKAIAAHEKNPDLKDTLHVVKAKDGSLAGIMEMDLGYAPDMAWVNDLMGHPGRILGETDTDKYKGAGSKLLQFAAKQALDNGKGVALTALTSAQPFYEKLGFKRRDPGNSVYVLEGDALRRLAGAK